MRPPADRWVQGNDSGTYTTAVDKFLIHTTEGGSIEGAISAYRANNSWPHLTVDCRFGRPYVRCGHLDLNVPARALRNESGGVQTNRDGVIQIEVVGTATRPGDIDWAWFGENVLGPIAGLKGIPLESTVPWVPYPASYGVNAAQRLSPAGWTAYRGVLGHQHAPENSHGDPGAIPIVTALAAAGGTTPEADMPLNDNDLKLIDGAIKGALNAYARRIAGVTDFEVALRGIYENSRTAARQASPSAEQIATAVIQALPNAGDLDAELVEAAVRRVFADAGT